MRHKFGDIIEFQGEQFSFIAMEDGLIVEAIDENLDVRDERWKQYYLKGVVYFIVDRIHYEPLTAKFFEIPRG
jgi:hypothetical protein